MYSNALFARFEVNIHALKSITEGVIPLILCYDPKGDPNLAGLGL